MMSNHSLHHIGSVESPTEIYSIFKVTIKLITVISFTKTIVQLLIVF